MKTKVKTKLAGVPLVQFGRNCKGSFEGYRIVELDRQRNSLKNIHGFSCVSWNVR